MKCKRPSSGERLVIYYAHPIWLYNTPEEKRALKIIAKHFGNDVKIMNPREYDSNPEYSRQKKSEGMKFCYRLVNKANCVVFQCFNISPSLKNFILDYLTEAEEYKGDLNRRSKREIRILHDILKHRKILTPGVDKEVNYALRHDKLVYELQSGGLRRITQKPNHKVLPRNSYQSFNKLLKAFRSKDPEGLLPPFWWLRKDDNYFIVL